ncbi:glycosyltransferase family 2 protein [Klebsiella quasipneumoniae]|uniref:glycosyltransferase family 2 protein n=1 Tax=Klebsiella quasipneumoniae TaxID=1463165 RepID=UPI001C25A025|nr:glycosyltransferase [Klebsiella quasipneumoniae]MBU8944556.1 glycosyltransferase [Klebsiella quasipneumoniae]
MSDEANKIVVSVIIPVYNAAEYIAGTLTAVLSQTLNKIEIIVIDDCSTDNTLDIVRDISQKDARVQIIGNVTNLGGGGSRNVGLDIAVGEYIIFLDDDDYIKSDMLEKMSAHAAETQVDVVVCRCQSFDSHSGIYAPIIESIRADLLPREAVFQPQDIATDFFRAFVWWPWDKLFRREAIISSGLRFQEIRTTNDLFFVCAFMLIARNISVLDEVLISHTINRSDSLSATRADSHRCALNALIALQEFMQQKGLLNGRIKDYKNYAVVFLEWHLNTISGPAFSPLFDDVKAFVSDLDANKNDFYDDFIAAAYQRIATLSADEYLFSLKDRVLKELEFSQANNAHLEQTIDILEQKNNQLKQELATQQVVQQEEKQNFHNQLTKLNEQHRALQNRYDIQEREMFDQREKLESLQQHNVNMMGSLSWRLTKPLRLIRRFFK